MVSLQGKRIVLGISGGIAAYKAAALCSKLVQIGAEVRVIMTEAATKFITPLTLQTISRNAVITDTFDERDPAVVSHIDIADSADLFVVAPATANIIGKMANGIADDMLSTTLLATTAPVLVAPAMNVHMYAHPAVEHNMNTLRSRGVKFADPGVGQLACGYVGKGRLAEPEEIVEAIAMILYRDLPFQGKKMLVTAGGTIERIDPVRYITNDSSGKMGYAVASAAKEMGADVTLISGAASIPPPDGVRFVYTESTREMYDAVLKRFPETDIVIKAAAVADYRPVAASERKLKKHADTMMLELTKNPDILQTIGERKTHQFIVGFAAETDDIDRYAMEKLARKHCDLVVANDVTLEGAGFKTDTNIVRIFAPEGMVKSLPLMSKAETAKQLLLLIAERLDRSGGKM